MFAPAKNAVLVELRMHMHGPATQLSHGVFLIRSTMLIAWRTLTGLCRRLTCYYALIPIPLQSCNRCEMRERESGACRVGKGMEQEDETRNPAWRTQGNESMLDVALSPLNQYLLLHVLKSSQMKTYRENLKLSSETY